MACAIFPDQGSNSHLLHWQAAGKSRTKSTDWNREFLLVSREQRAGLGSSRWGMAVSMDKLNMRSVLDLKFEH